MMAIILLYFLVVKGMNKYEKAKQRKKEVKGIEMKVKKKREIKLKRRVVNIRMEKITQIAFWLTLNDALVCATDTS